MEAHSFIVIWPWQHAMNAKLTNYYLTCLNDSCLLLNILNAAALQMLLLSKTDNGQMLSSLSAGGQLKEH